LTVNVVFGTDDVDGIPVRWVAPPRAVGAALWLTHLGGSAEQAEPMLTRLVEHGLLAVSFDPPGHGTRGAGSEPGELAGWVLSSFRRRMWPLLGQTVLECLRVLDWIDERLDVPGPRLAGGVSMGGDVAVALAGIDPRISRVAALVATPDWTRPGMRSLDEHPVVIDQGQADCYAQWFFDAFDPMTHLAAYARDVAISFQCGGADQHVPAEGARHFQEALAEHDSRAVDRVQVALYEGLSHLDAARDDRLYLAALEWLTPADPS
jgi:alpha-beta hydrolase superfamily lysophospholipase